MVPTPTATTNAQKLTVVVLIVTSILLCEFLATAIMLTISYFMTRYVCKYDIVLILYLVVCGAFVFFLFPVQPVSSSVVRAASGEAINGGVAFGIQAVFQSVYRTPNPKVLSQNTAGALKYYYSSCCSPRRINFRK